MTTKFSTREKDIIEKLEDNLGSLKIERYNSKIFLCTKGERGGNLEIKGLDGIWKVGYDSAGFVKYSIPSKSSKKLKLIVDDLNNKYENIKIYWEIEEESPIISFIIEPIKTQKSHYEVQ